MPEVAEQFDSRVGAVVAATGTICSLCRSATLTKILPLLGSTTPAANWLLAKASENRSLMPITSPVLRISGPRTMSTPDELAERKDAFLDRNMGRNRFPRRAQSAKRRTGHHFGRHLGDGHAGRFGHERHRAAGARIDFQHIDVRFSLFRFTANWMFINPITFRCLASAWVASRISSSTRCGRLYGGIAQAESPECTPASSMCSMMPDDDRRPSRRRSHPHRLRGVFQKAIDQHRLSLCNDERLGHKSFELRLVVADLHRSSAQHKTGSHQRRKADLRPPRCEPGPSCVQCRWRLFQSEAMQRLLEFFAIFGRFDRIDGGPNDRHAGRRQAPGPDSAESVRRTGQSRRPVARDRRCSAHLRSSAARRTTGRSCRSRY